MLYCVIDNTLGDIYGRFKTHSKALEYFTECVSNGLNVKLVPMGKEEYLNYCKKTIEQIREEIKNDI